MPAGAISPAGPTGAAGVAHHPGARIPRRSRTLQGLIISEIELLLAEKRTALSTLRTGIAVLFSPLTLFTILVATSAYYEVSTVVYFVLIIGVGGAGLLATGTYLVIRSIRHIHAYDRKIEKLKKRSPVVRELLDEDDD